VVSCKHVSHKQCASCDVLCDDSKALGTKAKEVGVSIDVQECHGAMHDWHFFAYMPEAHKAIQDIAAFVQKHTSS
jgi:acetyl esterase/lipase